MPKQQASAQSASPVISDKDVAIIKGVFNEDFLKSTRAIMLGLGATPAEKETVSSVFRDTNVRSLIWRRFLPSIDRAAPIGQLQDIWFGAEQMVFGQQRDTIEQAIGYKTKAIEMTKQALACLDNPDLPAPDINTWPNTAIDPLQIGFQARNMFIRHIDQQLAYLWLIAQQEDKTPKEIEKQRKLDSTK